MAKRKYYVLRDIEELGLKKDSIVLMPREKVGLFIEHRCLMPLHTAIGLKLVKDLPRKVIVKDDTIIEKPIEKTSRKRRRR